MISTRVLALAIVLSLPATQAAAAVDVAPLPLPDIAVPAAQPSLVTSPDGRVHLSWIERGDADRPHRLRTAAARADGNADAPAFGPVHTIAEGRDWFVNWADFPSMLALPNGDLVSYVLVKTAPMPYAYDLRLTRSTDGGAHWSTPEAVHEDGTPSEHGFAALWPAGEDTAGVAWLDGRNTAAAQGHDAAHDHDSAEGGAMTLRAALLSRAGKQSDTELDASTCDCCQTDVALAASGPVLVYRDRSEGEIRDISALRWREGAWHGPVAVHADGWHMPACPVNGPAVVAAGDVVHVAWYTVADGIARVRLARSDDGGASFAAPLTVAEGPGVLGRVDVQQLVRGDGGRILVSWLEDREDGQQLRAAVFAAGADAGAAQETVTIARLHARGHASGFPRMAVAGEEVWIVWTDVADAKPRIDGARLRWR